MARQEVTIQMPSFMDLERLRRSFSLIHYLNSILVSRKEWNQNQRKAKLLGKPHKQRSLRMLMMISKEQKKETHLPVMMKVSKRGAQQRHQRRRNVNSQTLTTIMQKEDSRSWPFLLMSLAIGCIWILSKT